MPLSFGLTGNPAKEHIGASIGAAAAILRNAGCAFLIDETLAASVRREGAGIGAEVFVPAERVCERSDIIVSFGGDGTMLASAQRAIAFDKPLLGVNLGKLGFLAEVTPDVLAETLRMVIEGRYAVEERLALEGTRSGDLQTFHALNDIVVSKSGAARVIQMDAFVDGEYLATFHADGMIVATPTGSTAYSLATGGPIVIPSSDVLIISPISAHALTARPVIVPGAARIRIEARILEGEILIMVDGLMRIIASHQTEVQITRASRRVKLVKPEGSSYFGTLRNKLMWGRDTRI